MYPYWLYILRCSDGSLYTGHTGNLEVRIAQHDAGAFPDCYTSTRRPVCLVYQQAFPTRDEALIRERQIKKWSRAKKEALIAQDWSGLSRLARGPDRPSTSPPAPLRMNLRLRLRLRSG